MCSEDSPGSLNCSSNTSTNTYEHVQHGKPEGFSTRNRQLIAAAGASRFSPEAAASGTGVKNGHSNIRQLLGSGVFFNSPGFFVTGPGSAQGLPPKRLAGGWCPHRQHYWPHSDESCLLALIWWQFRVARGWFGVSVGLGEV